MAGPEFDVKANVAPATREINKIPKAIDDAAKVADRANRKQYRPLAAGSVAELREAVKLMKELSTLSGQTRNVGIGGGSIGGSGPVAPITPPRDISTDPPSKSGGGGGRRGGRWSNYGQNTGFSGRAVGAFSGGVGGATSTIAGEAMAGATAGGGFSAMGLLRGGLVGAGLFAAFKAGSAVAEGYDRAQNLGLETDKLKRMMGDLGKNFESLSRAAFMSSNGLGINANEATKLAIEYNKVSGGLKGTEDMMSEVRNAVGFSKAYGLDHSQSGQFFGSMRYMSGGDEKSSRRLALLIGETISRTGMNARASELIAAIQQFASSTNRMSLTAPNVSGYAGAFSGMMGLGIKGMTSDTAMSIIAAANQSVMGMGAAGEAGMNFTMAAFNRTGARLNPIQAGVLSEGGMFGTRAAAFGPDSPYARYMKMKGRDVSGLAAGGGTNFEAIRSHLDRLGGDPDLQLDAAKRYFGLNSYQQASALMLMQPKQMGSLEKLLGRNNIKIGDVNETGISMLGNIATGSRSDLLNIYSSLKGRKGAGALSKEDIGLVESSLGPGKSDEDLRNALVKIAAGKEQEETSASKMLSQMKQIEDAETEVGKMLLRPMEMMRDTLLVMSGKGPISIRKRAAEMEKDDITAEYKDKILAFMNDKSRGGSTPEQDGVEIRRLMKERDERKKAVDQRLKDEDAAAKKIKDARETTNAAVEQSGGGGGGGGAAPASSDLFSRLIRQESRGKHLGKDGKLLKSSAGALGITQLMPKTGANPGYGVKPLQDESEAEYLRFGRDYLNAMLKEFGGDEAKALAAYNAGPGAVKKAVAKYGDNWLSGMPDETKNYVSSISGDASTPLPAGAAGKVSSGSQNHSVDVNVRMYDQSGTREMAAPVGIRKQLTLPSSSGK